MTQALDPQALGELSPLALKYLLPERPALIGEFSPAYEAFREATIADLDPQTNYEYIQALQLVDLNWAILQAKASADVELSTGTETTVKSLLGKALEREGEREYERGLRVFVEGGGDEDDFEDPVDWDAIELRVERITEGLKSSDYVERAQCAAEAISVGIDPRLILSEQLLDNASYKRHSEKLPDLEKRVRLLSAEYRELQRARPIDVIPASE
ncbi:hypothetical protein RBLE17_18410 [Rhodobacteraceae bacterium LE17]|jgi:hypothetical protein|nr:hypothetical protein [Rhodobacteraceae bacterium LE17]